MKEPTSRCVSYRNACSLQNSTFHQMRPFFNKWFLPQRWCWKYFGRCCGSNKQILLRCIDMHVLEHLRNSTLLSTEKKKLWTVLTQKGKHVCCDQPPLTRTSSRFDGRIERQKWFITAPGHWHYIIMFIIQYKWVASSRRKWVTSSLFPTRLSWNLPRSTSESDPPKRSSSFTSPPKQIVNI